MTRLGCPAGSRSPRQVVCRVIHVSGVLLALSVVAPPTCLAGGAAGLAAHTSCSESGKVSFDPGLRQLYAPGEATTETVSGTLSGCVGGGVTGGTFRGQLTSKNQSCSSGKANGTVTIRWNTGKTSSESFTVTTASLAATTFKGTVTAGLFAGDALAGTRMLQPVKGGCANNAPTTVASFSDKAQV